VIEEEKLLFNSQMMGKGAPRMAWNRCRQRFQGIGDVRAAWA